MSQDKAGALSHRTALVGFGNPCRGDDAIGPIIARRLYEALEHKENIDLLELCTSDFSVMERLIGYERAVIIDALADEVEGVGTVKRVELPERVGPGSHGAGLGAALALARKLGLRVPTEVAVIGIVIRQPEEFSERLSAELEERVEEIVRAVDAAIGAP